MSEQLCPARTVQMFADSCSFLDMQACCAHVVSVHVFQGNVYKCQMMKQVSTCMHELLGHMASKTASAVDQVTCEHTCRNGCMSYWAIGQPPFTADMDSLQGQFCLRQT
eukprot:scaffold100653_cov14-Tisochrysis_lutea.AAC.1